MAMLNLSRHKLRTLLSLLGIMLGVASLIILVSVVDGIRLEIEDAFSKAQGARVVPLSSSDPVYNKLDEKWVEKIERVQGVKVAVPVVIQAAKEIDDVEQDPFSAARILGIDLVRSSQAEGSGFSGEILEGRDFRSDDKGVALLGEKIKADYDKFLGTKIKVNDMSLKVIGIYTTGSDLLDNSILVSIDDAREITGFPLDKFSYINVQFSNPAEDKKVVKRINLLYGDEILAQSLNDFSAQFGALFSGITLLVVVIASIASIVASVGVINTMLMSVLERFKEIGALKAVGWSNGNIMNMVVLESLFIGIFGGILGVALGFLGSAAANSAGLASVVSVPLILGSFFGAVLIGVIGGVYPAFVASHMDPVEALRSE